MLHVLAASCACCSSVCAAHNLSMIISGDKTESSLRSARTAPTIASDWVWRAVMISIFRISRGGLPAGD